MLIDLHCDTIQKAKDENLELTSENLTFNIKKTKKVLPYIQCLGTFVHPKYNIKNEGFNRAISIIDNFYNIYENYNEKIYIIKNKSDFKSKQLKYKTGVILTIENGSAISSDLKNIDIFYEKGIRMMSVVWNQDNELACGANTKNDTGLTTLGKQYIKQLEKKNIIVDVSHMSEKSFYDTLKIISNPIIASHSCCKSICNNQRNLSDDQIKKIAQTNGMIGICFYKKFLTNKEKSSSRDIVKHINHIRNLVGTQHIGFGSDFDGIDKQDEPEDIHGPDNITKIIDLLKQENYKEKEIANITSENFIRILK